MGREKELVKRITEQNGVFIFLHIGRTAGTTFKRDVLAKIYAGRFISGNVHKLPHWPEEKRLAVEVMQGHLWYGYHRFLRSPYLYVTLLRHPVDRVMSQYYYMREQRNEDRGWKFSEAYKDYFKYSLEELVLLAGNESVLSNGMTKVLSGAYTGFSSAGIFPGNWPCPTDDLLGAAKDNLTKDCIFGFQGELANTVRRFSDLFGWSEKIILERHRPAQLRPKLDEISKSTIRAIESKNEMDLELYHYARKLLRRN